MEQATEQPQPRRTNRWYALALLTAIYTTHAIDRNVMSVVMEPIKDELQVSDAAMGALAGMAHTVMLAIFILPLGMLADSANRVKLISGFVIVWSGLTALGAAATSYVHLLLVRMGVGAAEAGSPPASIALISDMFSAKERPTAISLYYLSAAFGTGSIFLLGGYVAHVYGWRAVFVIAGVPGILLGLLFLLTVRDPRPPVPKPVRSSGSSALMELVRSSVRVLDSSALRWVMLSGAVASTTQLAFFAWVISFLIRVHDFTLVQGGLVAAAAAGIAKGLGTAVGGPLTSLLAQNRPSRMWRYPGAVLIASVPLMWALSSVDSPTVAVWVIMALAFVLGGWAGPITAIMISGADTKRRGLTTSVYQFACNLIGGFGALLAGALSDMLGGNEALGLALSLTLMLNLIAALGLFMSCRALGRAGVDEAEA